MTMDKPTICQEPFSVELVSEITPLLSEHHRETGMSNQWELSPNLDTYKKLHDLGISRIFTARENGVLIGYSLFVISDKMHSRGEKVASLDLLFIDKQYRKGCVGYKFMKECDEMLASEGVTLINYSVSPERDYSKLLERMGYKLTMMIYSRRSNNVHGA